MGAGRVRIRRRRQVVAVAAVVGLKEAGVAAPILNIRSNSNSSSRSNTSSTAAAAVGIRAAAGAAVEGARLRSSLLGLCRSTTVEVLRQWPLGRWVVVVGVAPVVVAAPPMLHGRRIPSCTKLPSSIHLDLGDRRRRRLKLVLPRISLLNTSLDSYLSSQMKVLARLSSL